MTHALPETYGAALIRVHVSYAPDGTRLEDRCKWVGDGKYAVIDGELLPADVTLGDILTGFEPLRLRVVSITRGVLNGDGVRYCLVEREADA